MEYITRNSDGTWLYFDIPAPIEYPSPPIWNEDEQIFYHPIYEEFFWGKTWGIFKQNLYPYYLKKKPNLKRGQIQEVKLELNKPDIDKVNNV